MNKIILLVLACTGLVITTPFTAQALDSEKIGQNLDLAPNMSIAQYVGVASPSENRDQYRNNQYRRNQDRQFSVYYRNRNVGGASRNENRQWTLESNHDNRRDARRAANRLERRGYQTYVQVSREVNRGNRG